MTERERMVSGRLYWSGDPELCAGRKRAKDLLRRYDQIDPSDWDTRTKVMRELLGHIGTDSYIEGGFRCDYGSNISVGDHVFINYDCVILDIAPVSIGSDVMIAPRVCLYAATHPTDFAVRNVELEYGLPITVGDGVWIGGNSVLLPGVTVGERTVIAAGSVVNRDLPANVVAAGNPCRVVREIGESDRLRWEEARMEYRNDTGISR